MLGARRFLKLLTLEVILPSTDLFWGEEVLLKNKNRNEKAEAYFKWIRKCLKDKLYLKKTELIYLGIYCKFPQKSEPGFKNLLIFLLQSMFTSRLSSKCSLRHCLILIKTFNSLLLPFDHLLILLPPSFCNLVSVE